MCGIVSVFDIKSESEELRQSVLEQSRKIRHRGPDWSGLFYSEKAIIAHERLSIVDPQSGGQPLYSKDKNLILGVNGEIYNHQEIRERTKDQYEYMTGSDCEVILALYQEKGIDFLDELNGIFAFSLYDAKNDTYLIARDHIGIIPLYMGWDEKGQLYVASELKALEGYCKKIEEFPPAHYYHSKDKKLKKWWNREWSDFDKIKNNHTEIKVLRKA